MLKGGNPGSPEQKAEGGPPCNRDLNLTPMSSVSLKDIEFKERNGIKIYKAKSIDYDDENALSHSKIDKL